MNDIQNLAKGGRPIHQKWNAVGAKRKWKANYKKQLLFKHGHCSRNYVYLPNVKQGNLRVISSNEGRLL